MVAGRLWKWIKAKWLSFFGPSLAWVEFPVAEPCGPPPTQSANICLASNGATERERSYARTYLAAVGALPTPQEDGA